MTLKFKKIPKLLLRNMAHFQFHTEFREVYDAAARSEPPLPGLYARYRDAYDRLDEGLNRIRKSVLTERIREADRARDRAFSGLARANGAALFHFDAARRAAAERLQIVFDAYGNIAKQARDGETAAAHNLVQELRSDKRRADVEAVGLAEWVDELAARNAAVEELVRLRGDEACRRTKVAVKPARAALDRAYADLTAAIEAAALLAGDDARAGMARLFAAANEMTNRYAKLIVAGRRRRKADAQEQIPPREGAQDVSSE